MTNFHQVRNESDSKNSNSVRYQDGEEKTEKLK